MTSRPTARRLNAVPTCIAYTLGMAGLMASGLTHAQLTHNITLGNPKALSLGNAVTADPPGIDSIHFNPAGLADIKGRETQIKVLAARMQLDAEFGDQHAADLATEFNQTYNCGQVGGQCFQTDPIANTSSSTSKPALMLPGKGLTSTPALIVPFGGIAVEDPDYGWTFATAFYSPESVGFERDENDPAAFQGYRVGTSRLTFFSPSVGMYISDDIAVGASIGFSWQGFGIQTKFRAPEQTLQFLGGTVGQDALAFLQQQLSLVGPYDNIGNLSMTLEDPVSLSFNLGALWQPAEWLSFGVVYQSESDSNLKGSYKMENSAAFLATTTSLKNTGLGALAALDNATFNAQAIEKGSVKMDYKIPQALSLGTSVKLFPQVKFNFDVKWVNYSVWDSLDFKFDNQVDFLTLSSLIEKISGRGENNADPNELRQPRGYKDCYSVAMGVEYQYDDATVLRAGFEPRGTAVPRDKLDLLLPIGEANLYSVGAGYKLDRYTQIDAAFAMMVSSFNLPSGTSSNANSEVPGSVVYNPYARLDMKGQTTAYLFALSYDQRF